MTNALVRLAVLPGACVATATAVTHPCDGVPTITSNRWFESGSTPTEVRLASSARDEISAYDAFVTNDRTIATHNADPRHTFDLGHNQFSDLSRRDLRVDSAVMGTWRPTRSPPSASDDHLSITATDPRRLGRTGGRDSDQGPGPVRLVLGLFGRGRTEGAYKIATGELVSLSEQQLVSCDATDDGCSGGLMDRAFDWIDRSGGLCAEAAYKYTSGGGDSGTCETTCSPVRYR